MPKKKTKVVSKVFGIKEAKKRFKKAYIPDSDPDYIWKELRKEIMPRLAKEGGGTMTEDDKKLLTKAYLLDNLNNHSLVSMNTDDEKLKPFLTQFSEDLIEEYDCETPSEKALAHVVVDAYARCMHLSRRLNASHNADYITDLRNNRLAITAKSLDQANRQFLTALQTLKQLKSPPLNVKVNAKAAFVGQNQQFNANQSNETDTQQ